METLTSHTPHILGPLTAGHYIQIGMGAGFFVPERDYETAQGIANATRRVTFLAVSHEGKTIICADRDRALIVATAGLIAWITPQPVPQLAEVQ